MIHITAAAIYTFPLGAAGLLLATNTGFTGTVTISDINGVQAVITNPATGNVFRYFGFSGAITIVTSAPGDLTASALNHAE